MKADRASECFPEAHADWQWTAQAKAAAETNALAVAVKQSTIAVPTRPRLWNAREDDGLDVVTPPGALTTTWRLQSRAAAVLERRHTRPPNARPERS